MVRLRFDPSNQCTVREWQDLQGSLCTGAAASSCWQRPGACTAWGLRRDQWCAMRCSAAGIALPAKHPVRSTPLSWRPKCWGRQTSPSLLAAALLLLTASQDRSLREGSALPVGHAHAMRPAGRTAGLLALLLGLACLAGRAAAMGREC